MYLRVNIEKSEKIFDDYFQIIQINIISYISGNPKWIRIHDKKTQ